MFRKFFNQLLRYRVILWLYIILAIFTAVQKYLVSDRNNYLMFSRPISIMLEGGNMYEAHPEYFYDIYKYSPTFPLLFVPFSIFPDLAGVILFNLVNALLLFFAIRLLLKDEKKACLLLLILLPELIISLQNFQINGIIAAFFILPFIQFEKGRPFLAAFIICLSCYVKIYGIIPAVLFLFYPGKLRFIASMAFWMVILFCLPLFIISPENLAGQYRAWFAVVDASATGSQLSVMGLLSVWTGMEIPYRIVQITGLIIVLLPLLRISQYKNPEFRVDYLASLMIFSVLFNQMAESPTFIIAMTGFGIWFIRKEMNALNITFLTITILLTSLSPSDLFPRSLRENFFMPYRIKAIPIFVAWLAIQYDLWKIREFGVNRKKTEDGGPKTEDGIRKTEDR